MFQVGGTLGAIVPGWLMDRFDPHRVLACSDAAAGVGSMAGGAMLAMRLPLSTAFAFVAVPCVIAGIAVLALGVVRASAKRTAVDAIAGGQA